MIQEMKDALPTVNLARLCRLLGVTRQSYYQHFWQKESVSFESELIIQKSIRNKKKP